MTEGRVNESNGCSLDRRIQYERDANESPSIAAATALAQYYGDDVTATSMQLYDYIDPDALDSLFTDTNRGDARARELSSSRSTTQWSRLGPTASTFVRPADTDYCNGLPAQPQDSRGCAGNDLQQSV